MLVFPIGQGPKARLGDERIDLDDVLPGFELTPQLISETLRIGNAREAN